MGWCQKTCFYKISRFRGGVKISRFPRGQNFATFRVFVFSTPFSIFFVFWVNFCQLLSSFALFNKKNHFFLKKCNFLHFFSFFLQNFVKKLRFFYEFDKKRPQTPGVGGGGPGTDWGGTPPPNGNRESPQTRGLKVDPYIPTLRNWKTCVSIHPPGNPSQGPPPNRPPGPPPKVPPGYPLFLIIF